MRSGENKNLLSLIRTIIEILKEDLNIKHSEMVIFSNVVDIIENQFENNLDQNSFIEIANKILKLAEIPEDLHMYFTLLFSSGHSKSN
jgi:hypothetical protein